MIKYIYIYVSEIRTQHVSAEMGFRQSTNDTTICHAELQHYKLFQFKCNLIYTVNHFIRVLKNNLWRIHMQIILYTVYCSLGWREVGNEFFFQPPAYFEP
jgi:hypothetical protein